MPTSPLSEASPDSLAELFSRDPEQLSRQDRDLIVKELRKMRVKFEEEDAKPKKKPKAVAAPGLTLADLGLLQLPK